MSTPYCIQSGNRPSAANEVAVMAAILHRQLTTPCRRQVCGSYGCRYAWLDKVSLQDCLISRVRRTRPMPIHSVDDIARPVNNSAEKCLAHRLQNSSSSCNPLGLDGTRWRTQRPTTPIHCNRTRYATPSLGRTASHQSLRRYLLHRAVLTQTTHSLSWAITARASSRAHRQPVPRVDLLTEPG